MFKYIVIYNRAHDPNNKVVQQPTNSFLGGYTTFGVPNSEEGDAYFTEQLDRITRAAMATNCHYIGYAFLTEHFHGDIYNKLRRVGCICSAGFIDRDIDSVASSRWVTYGRSVSLNTDSCPKDMLRFNGYFFDIGLNPEA